MQRSTDQKVIRIASFFNILQAAMAALMSMFFFAGSSFITTAAPSEVASLVQETGMTASELGGYTSAVGLGAVFIAVLDVVLGILGLRASNDASKIMPVWVLSIVSLASNAFSLIRLVMKGMGGISLLQSILPAVIAAVVFYAANNIKREIGR